MPEATKEEVKEEKTRNFFHENPPFFPDIELEHDCIN